MASSGLNSVDQILRHIQSNQNFVLQGGAGSGKTETLKRVIQQVSSVNYGARIICITHTNKAADEISDRVSGDYKISTIHSFISELIRPFKSNIKNIFHELFILPVFTPSDVNTHENDKAWKKSEFDKFKKLHHKLSSSRHSILSKETPKVIGKRDFDKQPEPYIQELNLSISELNQEIQSKIANYSPSDIFYSDTTNYNNFSGGYGHDGLIHIATSLFEKHPLLGKILSDRCDYIFIDEFQDTNPDIIRVLLKVSANKNVVIGLFGDSEQAIYANGIGDVENYISSGSLHLVKKADNYRCSPQVIKVANKFRSDELKQKVALKKLESGDLETLDSRQGSVKLYYSVAPKKPDTGTTQSDNKLYKANYAASRDELIDAVSQKYEGFIQLKLTNKAIAHNASFGYLWDIFSERYADSKERIKKELSKLQFDEIIEISKLFESVSEDKRAYNRLISRLKVRGFSIRTVADKQILYNKLKHLSDNNLNAYEAVEYAMENGFFAQTDSHKNSLHQRDSVLKDFESDENLIEFESLFDRGINTEIRIKNAIADAPTTKLTPDYVETEFSNMREKLKQKKFYSQLFSKELKLSEVEAFYRYEEDESDGFVTMHKTKGTGIDNVIVVLDEYSWTQYDFLSCFSGLPPKTTKEIQSRKLLYVACSRTKKNLVCVRLVKDNSEAEKIRKFFPEYEEITL